MRAGIDTRTESLFDDTAPASAGVEALAPTHAMRRLGEKLPRSVFLGTSSWNFPGWRGIVWAPMSGTRTLSREGLTAYSRHPIFRTTGIDRAYYRSLSAAQYRDFARQVPEDFRFLVKAPQRVTDYAIRDDRGRAVGRNPDYLNRDLLIDTFVGPVLEGLGERVGALVLELSPIPRDDLSDMKKKYAQIERIAEFCRALPAGMLAHAGNPVGARGADGAQDDAQKSGEGPHSDGGLPGDGCRDRPFFAIEMRTRALLTRRYLNSIRSTPVRPVVSLHPSMPTVMRQTEMLRYLDAPEIESGPWRLKGDIVIRWSLAANGTYQGLRRDWQPFDAIREPDVVTREGIVWLLALAQKSGVRAFAVANNKAEGCAPLTMRAIAESLTGYDVAREEERERTIRASITDLMG